MPEASFSSLGRVEAIKSLYQGTPFKPFPKMEFTSKEGCCTVSKSVTMLEGTDFDLVYFPLQHLGYKAVVAATGELYASFAYPRMLDVVLGVSSKLDYPQIKLLWEGIVEAAREHGYSDVALDLIPSRNGLCISVGATGSKTIAIETAQPQARTKDVLCLSGNVGGAFFGMKVLQKELERFSREGTQPDLEKHKMMVGYYLKPEVSPSVVVNMEKDNLVPSCGVFLRRGLADAVMHVSRMTGLGVKVYSSMLPFAGNTFSLGKEFGVDPFSAALNGGDDYRLLYVLPIEKAESVRHNLPSFEIIGHLAQKDVGCVMVMPEGAELPINATGWKKSGEDDVE